ncbi:uncharacterized protein EV422DRAFT_563045 [Fimicolochytrium jonesii]|uniref:uncharacterized protein n=1 Tax=Fimicolochytrium jonesii TaxID=1396493 RepID=UPI0022FF44EA|nr:uncharacterized protein EV422DRAFT_563045 [Fimicolochytrium jonesii]KAI8826959.1 hypothetical protein EV422DRAFT_563045 [Fimicolochytrium jonesii]
MSDFDDYDLDFQSEPELEFDVEDKEAGWEWEDKAEDKEEEEMIGKALEAAKALREEHAEQRRIEKLCFEKPGDAELDTLRPIQTDVLTTKVDVTWWKNMTYQPGSCGEHRNGSGHYIHLSKPIMKKKPRVEIVGVLLHWLLRLWIQLHMKRPPMDDKKKRHKHQFHSAVEWVEARVDIEIPISHNIYAKDAAELRVHKWRCTRCGRTYSSARNMALSKLKDEGKGCSPYAARHKKKCGKADAFVKTADKTGPLPLPPGTQFPAADAEKERAREKGKGKRTAEEEKTSGKDKKQKATATTGPSQADRRSIS